MSAGALVRLCDDELLARVSVLLPVLLQPNQTKNVCHKKIGGFSVKHFAVFLFIYHYVTIPVNEIIHPHISQCNNIYLYI